MKRVKKVADKILRQYGLVKENIVGKLRPDKYEELKRRNAEIEWTMINYRQHGKVVDECGVDRTEWLHEKMTKLTQEQMALYRMRFEEDMSLREIGMNLGVHHSTVTKMLESMYNTIRPIK